MDETILELRRVIYRCELLESSDLTDGDRQALWDSIVVTLSDVKQLTGCDQGTHELIGAELSRHPVQPGGAVVIPDGVSLADLENGCLAPPSVDPKAARCLAESLIERLEAS
ncbi:MAG: hypothetical protein ABIN55_11315 [Aeromicrobium sp.]